MTIPLTAFARQLYEGAGFFAQQQAAVIVLSAGLLLAIAVFAVAIWRVLRLVATWQQNGARMQANAALWVLSATALLVVLPVVLALLLPQHPAP
jgi:ABC-type nickel/cobalt efflux system permease component RcnA